jgi:hypothetical protein
MADHRKRLSTFAARVSCDALEPRLLFSTINWTNKGTSTSDTDGFNAVFAPFGDRARGIVQRAVDDWERVIVNFNRTAPGTNTFDIVIRALDIGTPGVLAHTGNATYDAQGKPRTATLEVDNNTGDMGEWYLDPLVGPANRPDDSEFTVINNPFQAKAIGLGTDLYRTVLHELGHAMGLASSSTRLSSLSVDIGDDPRDGQTAHLFTLDVNGAPGADYTYTNAGGPHLYEGPAVAGCPIHPDELMNAGRASGGGQRNLISDTVARLLQDVFGYTITLPSQLNTFYVQFNDTANTVTVAGDINTSGNDDDTIDIDTSGSSQVFVVNGSRESISTVEFNTITVNSGLGSDLIMIDSIRGGAVTTTTVNGNAGDDTLQLAMQSGDLIEVFGPITFFPGTGADSVQMRDANANRTDTYTISAVSVSRPAFTLSLSEPVEVLELTGQLGNNEFRLTASPTTRYHFDGGGGTDALAFSETASSVGGQYTIRNGLIERTGYANVTYASTTEIVRFDAGSGNDSFTFLPGDVFPGIGFNGNGGNDSLLVDDRADTGSDNYSWFGNTLQKAVAGNPPGTNPWSTAWTGIESATLQANNGNNVVEAAVDAAFIFGNGGNDTISLSDGTATVNTGSESPSAFSPFGDSLAVNLDANTGEDVPATVVIDQSDDVRNINVMSASTVGTLRITAGAVLMRSAGTGSGLTLTGVIDLAGGALLARTPGPTLADWRGDLIAGRNGGAWNGVSLSGAVSSSLAASTPFGDCVGYGLGSQIGIPSIGSFSIGAGDTLLRYTRDGDVNLDGTVNLADFDRLAAAFGQSNKIWIDGDSNYDGVVNLSDFNALAANFGQSVPALARALRRMPIGATSDADDLDALLQELS